MKYQIRKAVKVGAALVVTASLSGCFMAPGQHYVMRPLNNPGPAVAAPVKLVRLDYNLPRKDPTLFKPYAYRVGPEDILNITVWDHPELTIPAGAYRSAEESGIEIQANGKIFYPFAGNFSVINMTVNQIRGTLTARLKTYIQNPQISVRVAGYNSQKVQVLGSVKQPQTLPIKSAPLSLMQAINDSGGFDPLSANTAFVYLIRPAKPVPVVFACNADDPSAVLIASKLYLKNGDVVYVSTAGIVDWGRFVNNLLPSFSTAIAAAAIGT